MLTRKNVGLCLLTALFLLFILPGIVGAWIWVGYVSPYQKFRVREKEVLRLFDALNETTAKALPPLPAGSLEAKRWSVGITNPLYDHGRWLFIYIESTASADEISTYYRHNLEPISKLHQMSRFPARIRRSHRFRDRFLVSTGWSEYTEAYSQGIDFYFRDTSCLKILLPGQLPHYEISIWQDFKGQSFSPPLPDLNYMQFAEVGETKFATCPP